jgi:hypothetical protein
MTVYIEVLTEGASDVPVVKEMLVRHFGLDGTQFRIHPHKGRGKLPTNSLARPERHYQGLLDQLPAKLRGMSWLPETALVLVLIDADDDDCKVLLSSLHLMLAALPKRPGRVLFRIAVEETESWFLSDAQALKAGMPRVKLSKVKEIAPDAIVGAWEILADALGVSRKTVTGTEKLEWASAIAPHLNFNEPRSLSLRKLVEGTGRYLAEMQP